MLIFEEKEGISLKFEYVTLGQDFLPREKKLSRKMG
jgi:hypothetical protein